MVNGGCSVNALDDADDNNDSNDDKSNTDDELGEVRCAYIAIIMYTGCQEYLTSSLHISQGKFKGDICLYIILREISYAN